MRGCRPLSREGERSGNMGRQLRQPWDVEDPETYYWNPLEISASTTILEQSFRESREGRSGEEEAAIMSTSYVNSSMDSSSKTSDGDESLNRSIASEDVLQSAVLLPRKSQDQTPRITRSSKRLNPIEMESYSHLPSLEFAEVNTAEIPGSSNLKKGRKSNVSKTLNQSQEKTKRVSTGKKKKSIIDENFCLESTVVVPLSQNSTLSEQSTVSTSPPHFTLGQDASTASIGLSPMSNVSMSECSMSETSSRARFADESSTNSPVSSSMVEQLEDNLRCELLDAEERYVETQQLQKDDSGGVDRETKSKIPRKSASKINNTETIANLGSENTEKLNMSTDTSHNGQEGSSKKLNSKIPRKRSVNANGTDAVGEGGLQMEPQAGPSTQNADEEEQPKTKKGRKPKNTAVNAKVTDAVGVVSELQMEHQAGPSILNADEEGKYESYHDAVREGGLQMEPQAGPSTQNADEDEKPKPKKGRKTKKTAVNANGTDAVGEAGVLQVEPQAGPPTQNPEEERRDESEADEDQPKTKKERRPRKRFTRGTQVMTPNITEAINKLTKTKQHTKKETNAETGVVKEMKLPKPKNINKLSNIENLSGVETVGRLETVGVPSGLNIRGSPATNMDSTLAMNSLMTPEQDKSLEIDRSVLVGSGDAEIRISIPPRPVHLTSHTHINLRLKRKSNISEARQKAATASTSALSQDMVDLTLDNTPKIKKEKVSPRSVMKDKDEQNKEEKKPSAHKKKNKELLKEKKKRKKEAKKKKKRNQRDRKKSRRNPWTKGCSDSSCSECGGGCSDTSSSDCCCSSSIADCSCSDCCSTSSSSTSSLSSSFSD